MSASALERLRALLRDQGGLMASLVAAGDGARDGRAEEGRSPARIAAEGPRAAGNRDEYELLVEAIYGGYLLHYGSPPALSAPHADAGRLAGRRLSAIGL